MGNKSINVSKNDNMIISFLAASILFFLPIKDRLIALLRTIIILPWKIDTIFMYGLLFLLIILGIRIIFRRVRINVIALFLIILLSFLFSFIRTPNNYTLFSVLYEFTVYSFPALIIFSIVEDYKMLHKAIYISAVVLFIVYLIEILLLGGGIGASQYYSQEDAYILLSPSIIFFYHLTIEKKNRLINLFLFIISFFLMVAMGARGPIIVALAYVIFNLFLEIKGEKGLFFRVACGGVLIAFYFFWDSILDIMNYITNSVGLSTRIFDRMILNSFWQDSTRINIYNYSFCQILHNPILGIGLGNDRLLLSNHFNIIGFEKIMGMYSHNIVLEIFLAYGILFGSVIIFCIISKLISAYRINRDKDYRSMLIILFFISVLPLMVSGSFIVSPLFFSLIGFAISKGKIRKMKGKNLNGQID